MSLLSADYLPYNHKHATQPKSAPILINIPANFFLEAINNIVNSDKIKDVVTQIWAMKNGSVVEMSAPTDFSFCMMKSLLKTAINGIMYTNVCRDSRIVYIFDLTPEYASNIPWIVHKVSVLLLSLSTGWS